MFGQQIDHFPAIERIESNVELVPPVAGRVTLVSPFHLRDTHVVVRVPAANAFLLRGPVPQVRFPCRDGFLARPVTDGDAASVDITYALDPEKARLPGRELDHPLGHPLVTAVLARLRTAVHAPIPSARISTATTVKPGLFVNVRRAYRAS